MKISINSNASQPFSALPTVAPDSFTSNEKGLASSATSISSTKDTAPTSVDTVSISSLSQQKATDAKKEEIKKEASNYISDKPDATVAKVQFVYNPKGEISIRYMDTASRIIYQTPSELMLSLKDALTKSDTSVDTNA